MQQQQQQQQQHQPDKYFSGGSFSNSSHIAVNSDGVAFNLSLVDTQLGKLMAVMTLNTNKPTLRAPPEVIRELMRYNPEAFPDQTSSCTVPNTGYWTEEEHRLFEEGLDKYGKSWVKIASYIGTRNHNQVRSHAQKHFQKQAKKSKKTDDVVYTKEEDMCTKEEDMCIKGDDDVVCTKEEDMCTKEEDKRKRVSWHLAREQQSDDESWDMNSEGTLSVTEQDDILFRRAASDVHEPDQSQVDKSQRESARLFAKVLVSELSLYEKSEEI